MSLPFQNKQIILGVTGSIAAYKSAWIASRLTQQGALVDTILTDAAKKFITPLTFQSLTGRKALDESALWGDQSHVIHVHLAQHADALIIAPITANTIAKLANGICDNLLSITVASYASYLHDKPAIIAPAMDGGMYKNPQVQENLKKLINHGYHILGPEKGHLASGLESVGRMTDPETIINATRYLLTRNGPLHNKHLVITAGGTQEPIDPVRIITNRSSGKQGVALAQAALDAGAEVTLISPPLNISLPYGAKHIQVQTAKQMNEAVLSCIPRCDGLIMAAAVADFTPTTIKKHKIKKTGDKYLLELEPTPDILKNVASLRKQSNQPKVVVGFAAETNNLLENAQKKLASKGLDLIVANDVSKPNSGFAADTNQVTIIQKDGSLISLPKMTKYEVAEHILSIIAEHIQN